MVRILGGGPAGAAAAIAALGEGAEAEIYEEGRVPRHKVCGEFLSPEARSVLKRLGAAEECVRAAPARIDRFELHIGRRVKQCQLPEPAWGLSRYRLDHILLERAQTLGARVLRERRTEGQADVVAHGRRAVTQWNAGFRHNRPFGFKAHFRGPSSDAVELYFFQFGYIGVTPIEDGLVNICGLAREHLLREHGFDPGALAAARPDLAERLRPLSRTMDWMFTGPVLPREDFTWRKSGPYLAGDALGAVEPFTGTGILNAIVTGMMAGRAAARSIPVAEYFGEVQRVLGRAFLVAGALDAALETGWAPILAPLVPAGWLFRLTRPSRTAW